jgi:hypothetical protein
MKIKALRLKSFRRFREAVQITGLADGINVLSGPNETGKSTIYHALEAVFLTSYRMTGNALESMRPRGGGDPLVQADFETGGKLWRIEKQFGRGKAMVLWDAASGREIARSADAETALSSILGLSGDGPGRLGLVWVRQQRTLSAPDPDIDPQTGKPRGRGEANALVDAIGQEVEAAAGGEAASRVADHVDAALSALVTLERGAVKKNGPLDLAQRDLASVCESLDVAERAAAAANQRLDEIATLSTQLAEIASPAEMSAIEDNVRALQARNADSGKTRTALNEARYACEKCELEAAAAKKDYDDFVRLSAEHTQLQQGAEKEAGERSVLLQQKAAMSGALASAQQALLGAQQAADRARAGITDIERFALRADVSARAARLKAVLAEARDLEREIDASKNLVGADPATPQRLAEIGQLETQIAIADAELNSASPLVTYAVLPEGAGKVRIGGKEVSGKGEMPAHGPLDIEVDKIGAFRVRSGNDGQLADLRMRRAQLTEALERALASVGAATSQEARQLGRVRSEREDELASKRARLSGLAASGSVALAQELAGLEEKFNALPSGTGEMKLREAVEQDLQGALSQVEAHERKRGESEKSLALLESRLAALAASEDSRQQRLSVLHGQLAPFAAESDAASRLQSQSQAKAAAAAQARLRLDDLSSAALPDTAFAALQKDDAAASAALAKRRGAISALQTKIQGLKDQQAGADEDGRAGGVAAVLGEKERAADEVARLQLEVSALQLLSSTLRSAEGRTRGAYFEPVTRRLAPYLAHVLPNSAVAFGSDFSLDGLVRAGEREELATLSDGTREQLSVLVRMSFARLLADRGQPAPLILDDPLVYSDDERLAAMCRALQEAAQHHQVMLLTCRETAFKALAGRRLVIEPWRPA